MAFAIAAEDELDEPVAERANAVVKEDGVGHGRGPERFSKTSCDSFLEGLGHAAAQLEEIPLRILIFSSTPLAPFVPRAGDPVPGECACPAPPGRVLGRLD